MAMFSSLSVSSNQINPSHSRQDGVNFVSKQITG